MVALKSGNTPFTADIRSLWIDSFGVPHNVQEPSAQR